ncbi:caspase family protein, partial [Halorubrum sp. SS7]
IIARLMNSGFNLRTALHVAKRELITGHQYIVVGDGGTTICQSRSGVALVLNMSESGDGMWDITTEIYPNGTYGAGSMSSLNLGPVEQNYYIPTNITTAELTIDEISKFLQLETVPVFSDTSLTWSDEFLSSTDQE